MDSMGKPVPRPVAPYPLLMVEWEDAQRPLSPWQWVEDYQLPDVVTCLSVGYVIAETAEAVALAPNLGDIAQEKAQACGIIRIPQSSIRRTWKL
jgi:hypothetical protein